MGETPMRLENSTERSLKGQRAELSCLLDDCCAEEMQQQRRACLSSAVSAAGYAFEHGVPFSSERMADSNLRKSAARSAESPPGARRNTSS